MRALLAVALMALTVPAQAQSMCSQRKDLLKAITEKYNEVRVGIGMTGGSAVHELYVSKTGTYTIIVTRPDGMACVVAAGVGWSAVPIEKSGTDT